MLNASGRNIYVNPRQSSGWNLSKTAVILQPNHKYLFTMYQTEEVNATSSAYRNLILGQRNGYVGLNSYGSVTGTMSLTPTNNVNGEKGEKYAILTTNAISSPQSVGTICYWIQNAPIINSSATEVGLLHISMYDLTAMFGAGHEPTYDEFRQLYPCIEYSYNLFDRENF